eukprot:8651809-Pyramimonas_sp.AAC.1
MMRDAKEAWECWCSEASAKGARALRRVRKVREIPAPAVAQGNASSGGPQDIVQGRVDACRRLWKATDTAPFA